MLIFLEFRNHFLMFFQLILPCCLLKFRCWSSIQDSFSMACSMRHPFFFSLASSGLIRRYFAMSRINWLCNKFFFSFVFSFSFFYGFHRSKSLTLNLKFGFFYFHCLFLGE